MDVEHKINELFKAHNLDKIGTANVPYIETHVKAALQNAERPLTELEQYFRDNFASIVGSLIYVSITCRPDIVYSVNQMSKGMHNPKLAHITVMKQTLKYLNSHRNLTLTYKRNGGMIEGLFRTLGGMDGALQTLVSTAETPGDPIVLFSDSDYANDLVLLDDEVNARDAYDVAHQALVDIGTLAQHEPSESSYSSLRRSE